MSVSKRITKVFERAKIISMDDESKFIFFSDCHRGDGSFTDDFAQNQNIYYYAMEYYYKNGYTYVEIGDGDELLLNWDYNDIIQNYSRIFLLMHKYYANNRLYIIWGNHDYAKMHQHFLDKYLNEMYDEDQGKYYSLMKNIKTYEGLVLIHKENKKKILVIHGHQGDIIWGNPVIWPVSKLVLRYLWKPLEMYFGFNDPTSPAKNNKRRNYVEINLSRWVSESKNIMIAGHTHRPVFPRNSSVPYFNDGCCVHPYSITGIEVQNGEISLVKWSTKTKDDGLLYIGKDIISGPRPISTL